MLYLGCFLISLLISEKLEGKIHGSGIRSNTFLRQPVMKYVSSDSKEPVKGSPLQLRIRALMLQ